jgi:hypothetical protein
MAGDKSEQLRGFLSYPRPTRHFLPFSIETTKRSQSAQVSDRFDKILAVEFSQTDCGSNANASILPYLSRSAAQLSRKQ